jgi:hypothetical protein
MTHIRDRNWLPSSKWSQKSVLCVIVNIKMRCECYTNGDASYKDYWLRAWRSGNRNPVGRNFPYPFRSAPRPTQPSAQWVPDLFYGGKAAGAWRWPPTTFYRRCRVWVELYLSTCLACNDTTLWNKCENMFCGVVVYNVTFCGNFSKEMTFPDHREVEGLMFLQISCRRETILLIVLMWWMVSQKMPATIRCRIFCLVFCCPKI